MEAKKNGLLLKKKFIPKLTTLATIPLTLWCCISQKLIAIQLLYRGIDLFRYSLYYKPTTTVSAMPLYDHQYSNNNNEINHHNK